MNRSPLAAAGTDLTANSGDVITLDASKSKDPDNDPLKYSWVQTAGPRVKLDNTNTSIATFTAPSNISSNTFLIFKLTVADDKSDTGTDDTKVMIKHIPPPNRLPTASAGSEQNVDAGDTVQLDGTKSEDQDGNITSYSWSQLAGQHVVLNATNTPRSSFVAPSNVSADIALVFQLSVTDDENATDISITKITVKPANRAPIANAGQNQTVSAGDIATLDGSESNDPDGDSLTYLWKQTAGPTVILNGADKPIATFTTQTDITSNTTLLFELAVKDDKYAISSPVTVSIAVKAAAPPGKVKAVVPTSVLDTIQNYNMSLAQKSEQNPEGPNPISTNISLNAPKNILSEIQNVTYYLHPTFNPSTITAYSEENKFAITFTNWGIFDS